MSYSPVNLIPPELRGPRLERKQADIWAHATARTNIATGSVRSGKTVAMNQTWLKYATREAPPGDLLMVGRTLAALERNVINPLINQCSPRVMLRRGMSGAHELWISGRRVYIVGANDERSVGKIQGMTIAGWYGDEISLWPESFYNMMLSRLSVEGGRGFGTTNPDAPGHWLKRNHIDKRGTRDMKVWEFTLDDNTHLPPAYVTELKKEYVGLWYRRFILGQWVAAEGAVFDMLDDHLWVKDLPPLVRHWIAVDYGTTNPTTWAILSLGVDGRLYVHHSYYFSSADARRQKTDAEYSRDMMDFVISHPEYRPDAIWYDPSAASFGLQLWRDFRATPAIASIRVGLADNDVIDGIRDVASLLGGGKLLFHRPSLQPRTWDEMVGYSWDPKAQARGEDKPLKVDDHFPDALRYAVRGSKRYWRHLLLAS